MQSWNASFILASLSLLRRMQKKTKRIPAMLQIWIIISHFLWIFARHIQKLCARGCLSLWNNSIIPPDPNMGLGLAWIGLVWCMISLAFVCCATPMAFSPTHSHCFYALHTWCHGGNTEEESNSNVVFKWNIHWSAGKEGGGGVSGRDVTPPARTTF